MDNFKLREIAATILNDTDEGAWVCDAADHIDKLERELAESRANADEWMQKYGSTQGRGVEVYAVSQQEALNAIFDRVKDREDLLSLDIMQLRGEVRGRKDSAGVGVERCVNLFFRSF